MATEVSIVQGATEVSVVGSIPLVDDQAISFGLNDTVKLLYETADPNANLLILVFPEGGAVDVPGFVIGDASIDNVDLGFFNGLTEPFIAVVNDAADAYVRLDAGDDAVAGSKGLYFKAAADEDIELLNLSVTGTPRIYWDESEDQFRSTKGWVFDAACDVQGTWVATAAWTLPAFTAGGVITYADYITKTADNLPTYIRGGSNAVGTGGFIYIEGKSYGTGRVVIGTGNLAGDADVDRVAFAGNVDVGTADWGTTTQTNLNITSGQVLKVAGTQVVAARVVDARCDDVVNSGDATTDGVIDALRDAMITHGLIAAA